MNGIERLEEIKSRVWKEKGTYAMGDYSQREGYIYTLSDYDYEWLIEQAKRVQELERKIERYRKVLAFYADEETYETKFATDTDEIFDPFTLVELDEGKKARKALEGDSDE